MKSDPEMLLRTSGALIVLAQHGIEADIQDLLISGNASRGVAPGALSAAIAAALKPIPPHLSSKGNKE